MLGHTPRPDKSNFSFLSQPNPVGSPKMRQRAPPSTQEDSFQVPRMRPSTRSRAGESASGMGHELPPVASVYDDSGATHGQEESDAMWRDDERFSHHPMPGRGEREEEGSRDSTSHWVTVFGFPEEEQRTVYEAFSHRAHILQCVGSDTGRGNYMHLQLASAAQVDDMLQRNGTAVRGYLIGVIPASAADLNLTSKKNKIPSRNARSTSSVRGSTLPNYIHDPTTHEAFPTRSWTAKAAEYIFGF